MTRAVTGKRWAFDAWAYSHFVGSGLGHIGLQRSLGPQVAPQCHHRPTTLGLGARGQRNDGISQWQIGAVDGGVVDVAPLGTGVAIGYHRQTALTAERFIDQPDALDPLTTRIYRTGDRGRWRCDGVHGRTNMHDAIATSCDT